MDPAIQALTIRPADWAALLGGIVEGISYDFAAIACIGVAMAVLTSAFGRRTEAAQPAEAGPERPFWVTDSIQVAGPLPSSGLPGVVAIVSGPYAVQLGRTRSCARRRAIRRAAAPSHRDSVRY